jgi:hypothetical protein
MTWRMAHTLALIIGGALWVALWYVAGCALWWLFQN